MKKFLINALWFGVVLLILNQVPPLFLGHYYGNQEYSEKYRYFINNQNRFNTVILGSSRLYRHINPAILDDILKDYHISTFNLAAPSTFNPEVYYLFEKLLETIDVNSLKYVLIELQSLHDIERKNLNTVRNYYWHNWEYFCFSVNFILASKRSFRYKVLTGGKYFISYINKLINFYSYRELLFNTSNENGTCLGRNKDGFYAIEQQMSDMGGDNKYRKRLAEFSRDPTVLEKRVAIATQAFSEKKYDQFANEAHLRKLMDLIDMSQQKGVDVIFIIPPRRPFYNDLLAMKAKLPDERVIELANPQKYPELYQVEFSFDVGHLDGKGANIFTEYLADEIIMKVFHE